MSPSTRITPNPQLHPLETDPNTGEPFLRLRNHKNIAITVPRWEDAPAHVRYLNDPRVYNWLSSPPFSFLIEHAEARMGTVKPPMDAILRELEEAKYLPDLKMVGHCPISAIRELKEDGSQVMIGDIEIFRCTTGELMGPEGPRVVDQEGKIQNVAENAALPLGDPKIIWCIGNYLAPSHHRQGITTDALKTLLYDWAVPRMGVRRVIAEIYEGNEGSLKVFVNNGFKEVLFYEPPGKPAPVHVLEWTFNLNHRSFGQVPGQA